MIPKSKLFSRKEYKEFINKVMVERQKYVVFNKNFKVDIFTEFVEVFMKIKKYIM